MSRPAKVTSQFFALQGYTSSNPNRLFRASQALRVAGLDKAKNLLVSAGACLTIKFFHHENKSVNSINRL